MDFNLRKPVNGANKYIEVVISGSSVASSTHGCCLGISQPTSGLLDDSLIFSVHAGASAGQGMKGWLRSPLAFACPALEGKFVACQIRHFQETASKYNVLQVVFILVPALRMCFTNSLTLHSFLWASASVVVAAYSSQLLQNPPSWFSFFWILYAFILRVHNTVHYILVMPLVYYAFARISVPSRHSFSLRRVSPSLFPSLFLRICLEHQVFFHQVFFHCLLEYTKFGISHPQSSCCLCPVSHRYQALLQESCK